MLNQEALNHILDVNAKIDAKLSRHFRDMGRVYAVIARAAAKRRQWEEEKSEQGPHVHLRSLYTPWRTTWNGMASIGTGRLGHRVYTAKQANGPTTHRLHRASLDADAPCEQGANRFLVSCI